MSELRYQMFDTVPESTLVVDPFAVATVTETTRRECYGGPRQVAVIRLLDGKEYVVSDPDRKVAVDIWLGKSFHNTKG